MRLIQLVTMFALTVPVGRAFASDVVRVGAGGHATLQGGVEAASNGDVLLIAAGTYSGATIVGKGLVIVADGAVVVTSSITVTALPTDALLVLDGLDLRGASGGSPAYALSLVGATHARVQSCQLRSLSSELTNQAVASFAQVQDIAMQGCEVSSQPATSWLFGRNAISSQSNSSLVVDSCVLLGGRGAGGPSVDGVSLFGRRGGYAVQNSGGSTMFASASRLRGGRGGNGASTGACIHPPAIGGDGGSGFESSMSPSSSFLDCRVAGGLGGNGGTAPSSCPPNAPNGADGSAFVGDPVTLLPGEARTLECAGVVREGSSLSLRVRGVAGDRAYLAVSARASRSESAGQIGVVLVELPAYRIDLGSVAADGTLDAVLLARSMPAAVDARVWHLQLVVIDASGVVRFGSARVATVLDAAL